MEVFADQLFIQEIVSLALEARLKRKFLLAQDSASLEISKYARLEKSLLDTALDLHEEVKAEKDK